MALLHILTVITVFSLSWISVKSDVGNVGIVGGHTISIEEAPYMAAIFTDGGQFCGGSIIDEWFVLTAAHCMYGFNENDTVNVLLGSDDLSMGGTFIEVERLKCHDGYIIENGTSNDDLCLLKLTEPVPFDHDGKIAKVDLPDEDYKLDAGTVVNVTGWGTTQSGGKQSHSLLQTAVPLVGNKCCEKLYPDLYPTDICAGSRGHDSCQGDSGGPLTYNNIQIGVVSYGNGCGGDPGIYANVATHIDWIRTNMML